MKLSVLIYSLMWSEVETSVKAEVFLFRQNVLPILPSISIVAASASLILTLTIDIAVNLGVELVCHRVYFIFK